MTEALPRTRGFFQEMRNAMPQVIFAGETDLAFQILTSFKAPTLADQVPAQLSDSRGGVAQSVERPSKVPVWCYSTTD